MKWVFTNAQAPPLGAKHCGKKRVNRLPIVPPADYGSLSSKRDLRLFVDLLILSVPMPRATENTDGPLTKSLCIREPLEIRARCTTTNKNSLCLTITKGTPS